jgi:hypothetical protein
MYVPTPAEANVFNRLRAFFVQRPPEALGAAWRLRERIGPNGTKEAHRRHAAARLEELRRAERNSEASAAAEMRAEADDVERQVADIAFRPDTWFHRLWTIAASTLRGSRPLQLAPADVTVERLFVGWIITDPDADLAGLGLVELASWSGNGCCGREWVLDRLVGEVVPDGVQREPGEIALPVDSIQLMLDRIEGGPSPEGAVSPELFARMRRRDDTGVGGTDTDWKDVQGQLLGKVARKETYTSDRALGRELGCVASTIKKAIRASPVLKGWKARTKKPKAPPKATGLSEAVTDNMRQTREPAPDDVPSDECLDAMMAKVKEVLTPHEYAALEAVEPERRLPLAEAILERDREYEPSPLEPDKPGRRPREVRQLRRA